MDFLQFLDTRTVLFGQIIIGFIGALVLLILWFQNRKRFPSIFFWPIAMALQAVIALLISFKAVLPDWINIVVANVLSIFGFILLYYGLCRYLGKKFRFLENALLFIVFTLVHIYFTFFTPSLTARTYNVTFVHMIIGLQGAWLTLRVVEPYRRSQTQHVGNTYIILCLVDFLRTIALLIYPDNSASVMDVGTIQTLAIMSYQLILVLMTFALVLMVNQRLVSEVSFQEEKYNKAFQSSPYAMILTHWSDGVLVEANDGFLSLTGYSREEVIGKTVIAFGLWKDENERNFMLDQLARQNSIRNMRVVLRTKAGQEMICLFSADPISVENQKMILSSINNITEQLAAEEKLRRSEADLRAVIEHSPIGISIRTSTGQLISANKAWQDIWAISEPSILRDIQEQRTSLNFDQRDTYLQPYLDQVRKIYQSGGYLFLPDLKTTSGKPGVAEWVSQHFYAIQNSEGQVDRVVVLTEDISSRKKAEEDLRLAYERLQCFVDANIIGIVSAEASGKIILTNDYYLNLIGYSRQEFEEGLVDWRAITPPEWLPADENALAELRATGKCTPYEKEYLRRDGLRVPVFIADAVLPGTEEQIVAFITDFSLIKQVEAELRQVVLSLEIAEEVAQLGSLEYEVSSGFGRWSKQMYRLFGKEPADVAPSLRDFIDLLHPADRHLIEKIFASKGANGIPSTQEYRSNPELGPVRYFQSTQQFIQDDISKSVLCIGTLLDITERKMAEEALRLSEEELKKAQHHAKVGSWVLDLRTDLVKWSDEMYNIFGMDPASFPGTWTSIAEARIHPEDLKGIDMSNQSVMNGHKPGPFDSRVIWPDKSIHYVHTEVGEIILDADGKPVKLTGTAQDITKQKLIEAEIQRYSDHLEELVEERTRELQLAQEQLVRQEKLAVLGQLAGGVGHELRNPLSVMSNAIYFLKQIQPDASDKVLEYLRILENEIRTANKIITDLLDFSRIKGISKEFTHLPELIAQTLEKYPVPERIQVTINGPDQIAPVYVDAQQITQVFGNLVTNAIQAMPDGGSLNIYISTDNDFASIRVEDTGCGVSPENLARLFEPLFTTKPRGIGLGLAVSKKFVEANGGQIVATSKLGEGSTFIVTLPLQEEKNE